MSEAMFAPLQAGCRDMGVHRRPALISRKILSLRSAGTLLPPGAIPISKRFTSTLQLTFRRRYVASGHLPPQNLVCSGGLVIAVERTRSSCMPSHVSDPGISAPFWEILSITTVRLWTGLAVIRRCGGGLVLECVSEELQARNVECQHSGVEG